MCPDVTGENGLADIIKFIAHTLLVVAMLLLKNVYLYIYTW